MQAASNYLTEVQGLFCLLHVGPEHARELVEVLEIIDESYTQEVDAKAFATCYCNDASKLFRLLYSLYCEGLAQIVKHQGTAEEMRKSGVDFTRQQRHSSYFVLLGFLLLFLSLRRSEYVSFLLWLAIQQDEDKALDRIELLGLVEKLSKLIAFEDAKVQSQFAKSLFQFQKILDEEAEEMMSRAKNGSMRLEDVLSVELRAGQPLTGLLDHLARTFKESTLGGQRWQAIVAEAREAIGDLRSHYETLVEETHAFSSQHALQPHFDSDIFALRKHTRKLLRIWIRFVQRFKLHVSEETKDEEEEGEEGEENNGKQGGVRLRRKINDEDDAAWYQRFLSALGLVSRVSPQERTQQRQKLLAQRRAKQRQQRQQWAVDDSAYIEDSKALSVEELLDVARKTIGEVDDVVLFCENALRS